MNKIITALTQKYPFLMGIQKAVIREDALSGDGKTTYIYAIFPDRILLGVAFEKDGKISIPPVVYDPQDKNYYYLSKAVISKREIESLPDGYAPVFSGGVSNYTGAPPIYYWAAKASRPVPLGTLVVQKVAEGIEIFDSRGNSVLRVTTDKIDKKIAEFFSKYYFPDTSSVIVGDHSMIATSIHPSRMAKIASSGDAIPISVGDMSGPEIRPIAIDRTNPQKAIWAVIFPRSYDRRSLEIRDLVVAVTPNVTYKGENIFVFDPGAVPVSKQSVVPEPETIGEVEPRNTYVIWDGVAVYGPVYIKDIVSDDRGVWIIASDSPSDTNVFNILLGNTRRAVVTQIGDKKAVVFPPNVVFFKAGPVAKYSMSKSAENQMLIRNLNGVARISIESTDGFRKTYSVPARWVPIILSSFGFSRDEIETALLHMDTTAVRLPIGPDHMEAIRFMCLPPEEIEKEMDEVISFLSPAHMFETIKRIEKTAQEIRAMLPPGRRRSIIDDLVETLENLQSGDAIKFLLSEFNISDLKNSVALALIDATANDMDREREILERLMRALEDVESLLKTPPQ